MSVSPFDAALAAVLTAVVIKLLIDAPLESRRLRESRRWELKRLACLRALEIIDSYYTTVEWEGLPEAGPGGTFTTQDVRDCYNQLALACDSKRVLTEFKRCLHMIEPAKGEQRAPSEIVRLRNAIRKELGIGKWGVPGLSRPIDDDRVVAWVVHLPLSGRSMPPKD